LEATKNHVRSVSKALGLNGHAKLVACALLRLAWEVTRVQLSDTYEILLEMTS
jgi:hypothetical protein